MRSIATRASRTAAGMYSASCSSVSSALGSHVSRRGWRATSPGAAVSDALLDPVPRGGLVDRRDLAAVQVGHDQVHALPPPVPVQHSLCLLQGLGLVEDPVVVDGLGHSPSVSPGRAGLRIPAEPTPGHEAVHPGMTVTSDSVRPWERSAACPRPPATSPSAGPPRPTWPPWAAP